jgi:hypothetical protein
MAWKWYFLPEWRAEYVEAGSRVLARLRNGNGHKLTNCTAEEIILYKCIEKANDMQVWYIRSMLQ